MIDIDPQAFLRLWSVPRIGSQRIRNLIARFKSPDAVLRASPRELVEIEGIDKTLAYQIKNKSDPQFAAKQMQLIKKVNARLIFFWDKNYPELLKKIFDPPVLLFVRGQIESLQIPGLAVVGTRNPSAYGKVITEKLSREIASQGVVITSGLARGVDTIAHRSAVACGGKTVAVLGTGIDVFYPFENKELANQIIASGALISEFPMGDKPDAPHFPRRNRIIAGISQATLVIEAGKGSGALITADFALEQGKDIFAVPGNISSPKSFGTNLLIQDGAAIALCSDDILSALHIVPGQKTQLTHVMPTIPLSKDENNILKILSNEPMHIDLIAQKTDTTTSHSLSILLSLELKNLVRQMAGKNFVRI
ncbi:MAG: DNA-protecting protein DprA [Calditrichaeota bacterium]|nr:DNA-protecting protein DprA [Calditrichota bacterium]